MVNAKEDTSKSGPNLIIKNTPAIVTMLRLKETWASFFPLSKPSDRREKGSIHRGGLTREMDSRKRCKDMQWTFCIRYVENDYNMPDCLALL